MYGVDELKKLLSLAFAGASAVEKALADGQIALNDLAFVVPLVLAAGPAVKDIAMLPKELADLSESEVEQLVSFVREKLPDVAPQAAMAALNAGLEMVVALAKCVEALKK
jgi:hypothetical protein